MPRVVHFKIHADSLERAGKFFKKVSGWKIEKWQGPMDYRLVTTGEQKEPGINGEIMKRVGNGSVWNTVDVPSVDEYIQKIVKAGGKVVTPKTAVPGVGWTAYCQDSEGNVFGLMQMGTSAK